MCLCRSVRRKAHARQRAVPVACRRRLAITAPCGGRRKGLFEGADGLFDPDGVMTRAMLVQVLWRMEKAPVAEGCVSGFSDVPAGAWYHDAVCWAAGQKLVMGYDGRFAPDDPVTREQTAAILLRYASFGA